MPTMETSQKLYAALTTKTFAERRPLLRALATEVMDECVSDGAVAVLCRESPLFGEAGLKPVKAKGRLRDLLHEQALIHLIWAGATGWMRVADAIRRPGEFGVKSEKSKTGYSMGLHKDAPSVALVLERLREMGADKMDTETMGLDLEVVTAGAIVIGMMAFIKRAKVSGGYVLIVDYAPDVRSRDRLERVVKFIETLSEEELRGFASDAVGLLSGESPDDRPAMKVLRWMIDNILPRLPEDAFVREFAGIATTETAEVETVETETPEARVLAGFEKLSAEARVVVDMMLKKADMPGIEELVKELAESKDLVAELTDKLAGSMFETAVPVEGVPDYEVVTKPAHELFDVPGVAKASFAFEVPVLKWETRHPLVPIKMDGYAFRPDVLLAILFALMNNEPAWLWGHTGTGKTTAVEQEAARLGWPVFRINLDGEITRMDLMGRDTIKDQDGKVVSVFEEGVLPRYMAQPCIMLLDEFDAIRDTVSYAVQRVLETNGQLVLTEDGGRVVRPHPMFRIMATGNSCGQGDDGGLYPAVRPQSSALLDRFTKFVKVDYLAAAERLALIQQAAPGLKTADAQMIGHYVEEHLAAFATHKSITLPISPRGYQSLARAVSDYLGIFPPAKRMEAVKQAFNVTILDRANEEDRGVLDAIVQRVLR